jgi:hypothetical protein
MDRDFYEDITEVCPQCRSEAIEIFTATCECLDCGWEGDYSDIITKHTFYKVPEIISIQYK